MSSSQLLNAVGFSPQFLEIDNAVHFTSIFVHDPIESQKIKLFTESVAKAHGEEVIAKLDVEELEMDEKWAIVLTDRALYKFSLDQPLTQPRKRKPLTEYFDVFTDSSNPKDFVTLLYKDSLKTSVKASWQKLVGRAGAKIELSSLLQRREYICKSELQRDQFVWAFNKVLRQEWQLLLEKQIIPAPEIYQQHHLVIKQNKRGANQERLLVVSTQCLYNVELSHNPTQAEMRWYVPLQCLQAVALEEGHRLDFFFDADEIQTYIDQIGKKKQKVRSNMLDKSKLNETYQFLFQDDKSRADFVAVISHLYKNILHQQDRQIDLKVLVNATFSLPQQSQSTYTTGGRTQSNLGPGLGLGGSPTIASGSTDDGFGANGPLVRRGSNLDQLIQQHRHHTQESTELLCETLEKLTKGKVSRSHPKTFSLASDLTIRWGDSATKYKYTAKVIGVIKAMDLLDQLPPEQRPNFFALRTTEKPLYLLARDAGSAATWKATVEAYSGASQVQVVEGLQHTGSSEQLQQDLQQAELVKLNLTVPVVNGWLEKALNKANSSTFSNTHQRYFALHADGTLNWGSNPNKLKHSSTVIDVDQDISTYSNLPYAQGLRFIRIKTQTKVLELLCPNQESAERWFMVTNKVINPDYDIAGLESEDDHDDDDDDGEGNGNKRGEIVDQNYQRDALVSPFFDANGDDSDSD